jgi:gliding motility-associated-like protein
MLISFKLLTLRLHQIFSIFSPPKTLETVHFGKPLLLIILLISALCLQTQAQYNIVVDDAEGCAPMKVRFSFVSTATVDSIDTYYWSFGNGETSYAMNPDTVTFLTEGTYDPTLVLRFDSGLEQWIVKPDMITVHRGIVADFTYDTPSTSYYFFELDNSSQLDTGITYTFNWNIEEIGSRTGEHQEVIFPSVDTFLVSLTVSDEYGCSATVSKSITVLEEIYVPNVFTPDGSGLNDYFIIESEGGIPLRIQIFTRTGTLVYETEGPVITWDGQTASGDEMQSGVYYYLLEAISGDPSKQYSKSGFFHLYRNK